MEEKILFLEKSLFLKEYISNKDWLDNTIHDNFTECGKSGILFNKKGTVEFLLACNEARNITIYNFDCEQIDNNTWLVHYITKSNEDLYYRTSIWIMDKSLRMLYHQATKLNEEVKLIKF